MKSKLQNRKEEGFTIIEVLIVLAIAGLIILIVFLAVPSLQRNSRNTQRKNDVSAVLGALQESINNNRGTMVTGAAAPAVINNTTRTQLTNFDYNVTAPTVARPGLFTPVPQQTIEIRNGYRCNNNYQSPGNETDTFAVSQGNAAANLVTTTSATQRSAVVLYAIERQGGITAFCQEL